MFDQFAASLILLQALGFAAAILTFAVELGRAGGRSVVAPEPGPRRTAPKGLATTRPVFAR
jgi:hypothetical protein